jgi:protein-S-isoprenylcysteine O-methyltransferase Ste14
MLAMLFLHVVLPLAIILRAPFSYAGVAVAITGAAIIVWSRGVFQAAGTPIKPFKTSTVLIRRGLYRWTRNPMYLGAMFLVSGLALLLGSVTPWFVVAAVFVILQEGFVRHEERLLEQTFGEEYRQYKSSVRRWL